MRTWRIDYDPELLDTFFREVFPEITTGPRRVLGWRYRRALDALYAQTSLDGRDTAFTTLQLEYWRALPYEGMIRQALAEFAGVLRDDFCLGIGLARTAQEEGADLTDWSGTARSRLLLRPHRLGEEAVFAAWLRHEIQHLADLLDPSFGYDPYWSPPSPGLRNQILDRYRLFWAVSADGRTVRSGRVPLRRQEDWHRAFQDLIQCAVDAPDLGILESLWEDARPTHAGLLRYAEATIQNRAVPADGPLAASRPGVACPLCGFPTHVWVSADALRAAAVVEAVQSDYPAWRPADGICTQCWERSIVCNAGGYP